MNQKTFVEGCLSKYRWETIPEGQVWHDAHYPVPECLGGTDTIKLWESDHAVQGVYQSEEVGHPCIFGWEKDWLEGELLERFTFWRSELGRYAQSCMSTEDLRNGMKGMRKKIPFDTPETRQKQKETLLRNNPNHYSDLGKKARASETQEVLSSRGHLIPRDAKARGREKTNTTLYVCLKTFHISTAGPLTIWQKKRKIDTTLRINLNNFDNPISK
jgi:hypothetical protein